MLGGRTDEADVDGSAAPDAPMAITLQDERHPLTSTELLHHVQSVLPNWT